MLAMILQEALSLPVEEKLALCDELKAMVMEELSGAAGDPEACPRCGRAHVVRKGRGADGSQRWLCRGCGRTFNAGTRRLLASSKLPAAAWSRFVELSLEGASIARCAADLGVCAATAWFMRIRLCEVMRSRLAPFRPGRPCQLDGTYLAESLKGCPDMPRAPRADGRLRVRGVSDLQICVECGVNDLGDCFCEVCDRGRPTDAALRASLGGRVGPGSRVTTDGLGSYGRVLAGLGVASHEAVDAKEERDGRLRAVNCLHGRLDAFLRRFHGVSTRWLQWYLDWFCWLEQRRRSDERPSDVLAAEAAAGRYEHTRRDLLGGDRPFWDYWRAAEREAKVAA